ncbi:MAG: hypothetical protein WDN75_20660 [Bacteroidota bacterium]
METRDDRYDIGRWNRAGNTYKNFLVGGQVPDLQNCSRFYRTMLCQVFLFPSEPSISSAIPVLFISSVPLTPSEIVIGVVGNRSSGGSHKQVWPLWRQVL